MVMMNVLKFVLGTFHKKIQPSHIFGQQNPSLTHTKCFVVSHSYGAGFYEHFYRFFTFFYLPTDIDILASAVTNAVRCEFYLSFRINCVFEIPGIVENIFGVDDQPD
jgi:hypothetical protein